MLKKVFFVCVLIVSFIILIFLCCTDSIYDFKFITTKGLIPMKKATYFSQKAKHLSQNIKFTDFTDFKVSTFQPSLGPTQTHNNRKKYTNLTHFIPNPQKSLATSQGLITTCKDLQRRRIGNQLFIFASVYGIARKNGMTPIFKYDINKGNNNFLPKIFKIPMQGVDTPFSNISKVHKWNDKHFGIYDSRTENLSNIYSNSENTLIQICGYLQSWKYFSKYESEIRKQLALLPETKARSEHHLRKIVPAEFYSKSHTRIGIHIRRGDMLRQASVNIGYSVAPVQYFYNAMEYFNRMYNNTIFITCTNDINWAEENIKGYNIFYSKTKDSYLDFTTLAVMDHNILSVGTFGWWAAWLANGTTVYYNYPYLNNTRLSISFKDEDYYPPHWIPIGNETQH